MWLVLREPQEERVEHATTCARAGGGRKSANESGGAQEPARYKHRAGGTALTSC